MCTPSVPTSGHEEPMDQLQTEDAQEDPQEAANKLYIDSIGVLPPQSPDSPCYVALMDLVKVR